jgi:hypothetical protein
LFAFSATGVALLFDPSAPHAGPIFFGVVVALVVGKPLGVLAASGLAIASVALPGIRFDDAGDDVTLDELALLARGLAEGVRGEAVEIAHGAEGGLVEEDDGVGREDLAVAAGARQAHAQVLGGVLGGEGRDVEAVVDARIQRAVAAEGEALAEFGEADEDEREERAAVPGVVRWAAGAVPALRRAVSGRPLPNPACTFRYAPGSPSMFLAK